jgi:ankyrin repeat protein
VRLSKTAPKQTLLLGFEIHSTEEIKKALAMGLDVNGLLDGKTPMTHLIEMYLRSPRFSDCVRCLLQAGARFSDSVLLAVLLDDAELLRTELRKKSSLIQHRVDLCCTFTPLRGASLLHVAAEYGLLKAAATLIEAGADLEARAAVDDFGFNGHTPIFHTVCQNENHCQPVLRLLLKHGAKTDIRLAGITWGKGFEWETTIFDATPISYAQAGLLRQFQREEGDVYENIRLLAKASGRLLPKKLNVPNEYLRKG